MILKLLLFILLVLIYQSYSEKFQYENLFPIISMQCLNLIPIKPLKTYKDLYDTNLLKKDLSNLGGIYGLIHIKSSKQYIGSSLNLYSRLMDHIKGRNSNLKLQRSLQKYGLNNFKIVIYYFHKDPSVSLTDIETTVISAFPFSSLFNIKKEANSMLRYKHTKQAIEKMKSRFVNKINHPMLGKTHSDNTKKFYVNKKSLRPLGLYDENYNLIEKLSNRVQLANKFNVHKTTISRYIKSGRLFKGKFYVKEINK